MKIIIIFIVLLSLSDADYHGFIKRKHRKALQKQHKHSTDESILVTGVKLYYSHGSDYKVVEEYKIHQKSAINCFEEYLAITFQRVLSNGTTITSISYLNDVQINFNSQSLSKFKICRKIRKFYVNSEQVVISVYDYYHLVDIDIADEMILEELWFYSDYWTWFCVYFGIYNEYLDETEYIFGILLATGLICWLKMIYYLAHFFLFTAVTKSKQTKTFVSALNQMINQGLIVPTDATITIVNEPAKVKGKGG